MHGCTLCLGTMKCVFIYIYLCVCVSIYLYLYIYIYICCCCCSVAKSYSSLCDPKDCSMPSSSVLQYLLELSQIHVHWVGEATWSSHPLLPHFFASSHFQHQGLSFPMSWFWEGNNVCVCVCVCVMLSCVQLFTTPWAVACQALLSMGFSRKEYWMGCHFLLQGIFPTQGLNTCLLHLLHSHMDSLPFCHIRNGI